MNRLFLFLLLLISVPTLAQFAGAGNYPVKGIPVKVKDWGSLSLYIMSDRYFEETKDSILAQIGSAEFEEVEKHCSIKGWPDNLYRSDMNEQEDSLFGSKLNKLNMYRIASYTHKFNGKTFDRYVLLRIPYSENILWDPAVSWNGNIYFMLKEKDISLVNQ